MSNFKQDVKDFYKENKHAVLAVGVLGGISVITGVIGHVAGKLVDKVIK